MKISRFLKTILMTDFIGGLLIAIKELFSNKILRKFRSDTSA